MSEQELELARISFRSADGSAETMWAFDLGDNHYRLDNNPWFQYGVSYRDIVEALPEADGLPVFTRVLKKSGHRTVRVAFEAPAPAAFLQKLTELGASYEGANSKFFSVDIPPTADFDRLISILIEAGVQWEYGDPTYDQVHGSS